jgi:subtilisin family serine protease
VGFPGCISFATTVGATDDNDNIAGFSNQQQMIVDVMAPGVSINAGYPDGRQTNATLSGTSMATPHVAGAFAQLREAYPTATVDELEQALRCMGAPVTRSGTTGTFWRINVRAAFRGIRSNSVPNC